MIEPHQIEVLDVSNLSQTLGGDETTLNALLLKFQTALLEEVQRLRQIEDDEEFNNRVLSAAHRLKSSSRTVGARQLAAVLENIDQNPEVLAFKDRDAILTELYSHVRVVIAAIEARRESGAGSIEETQ